MQSLYQLEFPCSNSLKQALTKSSHKLRTLQQGQHLVQALAS